VVLALRKALFFCLVNLRVVVSIQELICGDLVCLCGTCLSRSLSMLSLKEVHMSLMVENGVAVNLLIYAVTSVLNSVILALSHRCIVLLVGLVRLGLMRVSISTASWSPTPGIGLQRSINPGLLVKNMSRVLFPLVGNRLFAPHYSS